MSNVPKIALATIGAGIFAGAVAQLWQALRSSGVIPTLSPSVDPNDPTLQPVTSTSANSHKWARPILVQAFQNVMGRDPTPTEIQYAHAIAWLETNYGNGWKGAMVGSNNWGAVQCPANAQNGVDCIPYQDSQSSGQTYKISFRKYASPVAGAEDVIKHIFKLRPITAASLAAKEPTFSTSYDMRREKYYGGFCPNATAKYGAADANASFGHPDKNAGTEACEEEAVTLHALRAHKIIQNVASALGEPVTVPLGTFAQADKTYKASHTTMAGKPFINQGIITHTPSFGLGAVAVLHGVPPRLAYEIAGLDLEGGYPWT